MRALGVLVVTGVGTIISKKDVNAPFQLVGVLDLILVIVCILLVIKGSLKE